MPCADGQQRRRHSDSLIYMRLVMTPWRRRSHEAGHQLNDGGTDEALYNGYGKAAVDAYNADGGGAQCAGPSNF